MDRYINYPKHSKMTNYSGLNSIYKEKTTITYILCKLNANIFGYLQNLYYLCIVFKKMQNKEELKKGFSYFFTTHYYIIFM